jgi:hypothetical protein
MMLPLTAVSMVSSCNMMILFLPQAPGGMPVAVMAMLMVRMPALFDQAGQS